MNVFVPIYKIDNLVSYKKKTKKNLVTALCPRPPPPPSLGDWVTTKDIFAASPSDPGGLDPQRRVGPLGSRIPETGGQRNVGGDPNTRPTVQERHLKKVLREVVNLNRLLRGHIS